MKRFSVRVSPRVADKVDLARAELQKLGVRVSITRPHATRRLPTNGSYRIGFRNRSQRGVSVKCKMAGVFYMASQAWLVFNILEKAIGYWPKIRKVLIDAGLNRDEIITLGLGRATRKAPNARQSRKQ